MTKHTDKRRKSSRNGTTSPCTGRVKRRFRSIAIAVILTAIALLGYPITGWLGNAATGNPVPAITLDTLNGRYVLEERNGRVAVLFFSFPG